MHYPKEALFQQGEHSTGLGSRVDRMSTAGDLNLPHYMQKVKKKEVSTTFASTLKNEKSEYISYEVRLRDGRLIWKCLYYYITGDNTKGLLGKIYFRLKGILCISETRNSKIIYV
jgi:hypothetical protein